MPPSDIPAPKLHEALRKDRAEFEDCTSCRMLGQSFIFKSNTIADGFKSPGSAVFVGMGAFTYFNGHYNIRKQEQNIIRSKSLLGVKSRGAAITGMSISLIGLGVYRLFN
jgi:hypothetical protein